MNIGIYSVSTQSGRAFLSDFLSEGHNVYGYARETTHGKEFVDAINSQQGIYLQRPQNANNENDHFIPLGKSKVGHSIEELIKEKDIIFVTHPSNYLLDTFRELKEAGLNKTNTPVVLVPPRTMATPYLWRLLDYNHPIICFSTCPYSCKAPNVGSAYIKRRKRNWMASLEGKINNNHIDIISKLFPQALLNRIPATTSIGNIGLVFHPTPYIMNYDSILNAQKNGLEYSFYMEAIANNPDVSFMLGEIDQIRLKVADYLGIKTYGLYNKNNEIEWKSMMEELSLNESECLDISELRKIRHSFLSRVCNSIPSAQHWLEYTYGVKRIMGESIGDTISRTPTYQRMSTPQLRYVTEDVPTGLVPIHNLANRMGINTDVINKVMDEYYKKFSYNTEKTFWRDLSEFSDDYLFSYLKGQI